MNRLYKNESVWKTKKAHRAQFSIALSLTFMLAVSALVHTVQAGMEPKVKTFVNQNPLRWDTGKETESSTAQPETQDEVEGGVLVQGEIERKIVEAFPGQERIALAVAKSESGLNPSTHSMTDRMADGRPFSIGLMQINLTVHKVGGKDCYKAFSGRDYKAKVVNEELYQECVRLAEDAEVNLATAKGIWERSGKNFGKWGGYTSGGYLKHM